MPSISHIGLNRQLKAFVSIFEMKVLVYIKIVGGRGARETEYSSIEGNFHLETATILTKAYNCQFRPIWDVLGGRLRNDAAKFLLLFFNISYHMATFVKWIVFFMGYISPY